MNGPSLGWLNALPPDALASLPENGPPPPTMSMAPPPAAAPPPQQPGGAEGFLRMIAEGVKAQPQQAPEQPQQAPQQSGGWLGDVYKTIANDAKEVAEKPAPATVPVAKEAPAPDVQYIPTGASGGGPAHEAKVRGPIEEGLRVGALEPIAQASQEANFRSQLQAQHESDVLEQQADDALKRREAAERVVARRQQELAAMQQDYQESVTKMADAHIDSNRYWAEKSTPNKIGTILAIFLGGLGAGATGGRNLAYERVIKSIDDDVNAQKFDYQVGLDQAKARQTSYGMMLDRYGSEDAANAAARAAAIDFTNAKLTQLSSQWKSAESQNAAADMQARLLAKRNEILADGFRFIPASSGAPRYAVAVRGQLLPGTVTEPEAQRIALEHGVKPAERVDEKLVEGGIQAEVAKRKAQAERGSKVNEETRDLAKEITKAGIPKLRALANNAETTLNKSPGGVGEAALRGATSDTIYNKFAPDDAAREEAFAALQNANWHELSGGAVTPSEESRLKRESAGIVDPEGRRRWLARVRQTIGAAEDTIKAGASDEARAEFERRQGAVKSGRTSMPSSFTQHGGK